MFILQSLWFFLPAGLANMAPVWFKNVNFLNYPIDFGKKVGDKPLFGSHKTFRGFFFGILVSIVFVWIQQILYLNFESFRKISLIPYDEYNFVLVGFLSGFGALLGDAIKSLIKRRFDVAPGKKFVPWDQIDFIVGFLLLISFVFVPSAWVYLFLILLIPFLHILINHIGFWLKIQDHKW